MYRWRWKRPLAQKPWHLNIPFIAACMAVAGALTQA
jgi:hypothetical protein